jgi:hypothetical protein
METIWKPGSKINQGTLEEYIFLFEANQPETNCSLGNFLHILNLMIEQFKR